MDQLKNFLGIVKRQHFWFLSPILLVIGIVGWMMSTQKLSKEFDANKVTVNSYIQQMGTVSQNRPHPNDEYHQGMEQLIAERRENVRKAWEKKWERQKQELKWPTDLPAGFLNLVEGMRPIEKVDVNRQPIPEPFRRSYQSFIKLMLPRLAEKIDAKWAPAGGGRPGGFDGGSGFGEERAATPTSGGEEGGIVEEVHLVDWDPANQGLIEARFDWGAGPPSTLEVLYAQEDLWVLADLIDIIKRTNGEAIVRSQAPIKAILAIEIGKDVKPPSTVGFHVVKPPPLMSEDGASEEAAETTTEAEPSGEPRSESAEGAEPGAPPPPNAMDLELVKNRYYDANYEPIADKQMLLESVTVAKRIPVRIRLQMDQRQVHRLLVECANSPLTFEVRQLRLNPTGISRTGFGGGREAAFAGEGAAGGLFARSRLTARRLDDYQSFDRVVELFGIIYIFNPVSDAVLDLQITEAVPAADTSAAAPSPRATLFLDEPRLAAR